MGESPHLFFALHLTTRYLKGTSPTRFLCQQMILTVRSQFPRIFFANFFLFNTFIQNFVKNCSERSIVWHAQICTAIYRSVMTTDFFVHGDWLNTGQLIWIDTGSVQAGGSARNNYAIYEKINEKTCNEFTSVTRLFPLTLTTTFWYFFIHRQKHKNSSSQTKILLSWVPDD